MVRGLALLTACLALAGCFATRAPVRVEAPAGRWYLVAQGETLAEIAAKAGVPAEDILEVNGLERPEQVTPGTLLFVLEGRPPVETPVPSAVVARAAPELWRGRLQWPLANPFVGSAFGRRDGRPHEGIDLPAPLGTPVLAAAAGRVVYAGNGIRGYGNLIVLQHAGDLLTVYAHNARLLVGQGQVVRAGQRVALVGQTGHATGPHLHFEVREGQIPRDPLAFLGAVPSARVTGGIH